MVLGIATVAAWLFAVIVAIATWVDLNRDARKELDAQ